MGHANFACSNAANDPAGLPLGLSIFADRAHLAAQLREDAEAPGFRIAGAGGLKDRSMAMRGRWAMWC